MKKITGILFAGLLLLFSSCTKYYFKRANKEFDHYQYSQAIIDYKKVINRSGDHMALIKLAHCYRLTNDIDNAEVYFKQIITFPESEPSDKFYYAKILMSKNKCPEAVELLKQYLAQVPSDVVAKMLIASCNSVSDFMRDTTLFTLKEAEIPEVETAFGQVPYKKGIVFTANKNVSFNSQKESWTGKSYYDLYFSQKDKQGKWISPQLLQGVVNGRYHEGPATFNKEGNVVYFTRSNYIKYNLKANSNHVSNLKIFKAQLVGNKWEKLEELPFNSDDYSVGQPCLDKDGKTLYFVSDMPGGLGGTDIYKTVFDGKTWSKPESLGSTVNTPGNEMFPYISEDGSFYFSSDAHNNMGGLDVFVTSYDEKNKQWLQVENLNYPLNSNKDDFAFVLNTDQKTGFVSSNRGENDNVFEFKKNDPTFKVKGRVTVKNKGIPFKGATVSIINDSYSKNHKITANTDSNGYYEFRLQPGTEYEIFASKENYFTQSSLVTIVAPKVPVSTIGKKYSQDTVINFELEEIVLEKPIKLHNIYYDLDKWKIRPDAVLELDKLVKLLKNNPNIYIEMGAHTDSRAGDHYNLVLSDKRAQAAVDYLVFKGIDISRLKYKGYGETRLVNRCKNGVECTEEEHQQNRRTEFKVVKIIRP